MKEYSITIKYIDLYSFIKKLERYRYNIIDIEIINRGLCFINIGKNRHYDTIIYKSNLKENTLKITVSNNYIMKLLFNSKDLKN